jgi:hypothetical protein
MNFKENNEKFEGKMTRILKEKHREFFTRVGENHILPIKKFKNQFFR